LRTIRSSPFFSFSGLNQRTIFSAVFSNGVLARPKRISDAAAKRKRFFLNFAALTDVAELRTDAAVYGPQIFIKSRRK